MLSLNDDCGEYLIRKLTVYDLTSLSMTSHDMQTSCLKAARQIIDDFKRVSNTDDVELPLHLETPFHRMARLFGVRFHAPEFELACLDSIENTGPWFADPKCEPAATEKLWAVIGQFPLKWAPQRFRPISWARNRVGVKRTRPQLYPELGEDLIRIACTLVQYESKGSNFTVKHRHIDGALGVLARARPFALWLNEDSV